MWQILWQCYIYSSDCDINGDCWVWISFDLRLTPFDLLFYPKVTQNKLNTSIYKVTKTRIFSNFSEIKISFTNGSFWVSKICLNWILEHQKNFHPFLRDIGRDDFFQIFGFFEILEFWKKFQNNKIIFDRLNFWIIFYWGNYSRISFFSIQECSTNYYGVFKTWIWRRTNAKSEWPFNFLTGELWRHQCDVINVTSFMWRHLFLVIWIQHFHKNRSKFIPYFCKGDISLYPRGLFLVPPINNSPKVIVPPIQPFFQSQPPTQHEKVSFNG